MGKFIIVTKKNNQKMSFSVDDAACVMSNGDDISRIRLVGKNSGVFEDIEVKGSVGRITQKINEALS